MPTAPVIVGGYKMTDRALTEAGLAGMDLCEIKSIMQNTKDQRETQNGQWLVTDKVNTALVSPMDSLITSVVRGHRLV